MIKKIVECRIYADRCDEWCAREKNRARRDEEFFLFRFGAQLADFIRQKIAGDRGRRKSVSLPAGVVGFRTEAEKIVVDDEDAVVKWVRENHPEFITTVERLSRSGLNEHIQRTGELPDAGLHIEPAREKFYVR